MKSQLYPFFFLLLVLGACGGSEALKKEFMQIARGEVGEIILVMDSTQFDGALGEAIKGVFREPMRGLPQDEPLFNINKVNPRKLNNILKSAANMVFVMTLDSKTQDSNNIRAYFTDESLKKIQRDTAVFMTVRKDEFARGQVVLFLFSNSEATLIQQLKQNKGRIQEYFETVERARIKERILKSRETDKERAISAKHPFTIQIPYGWDVAKNENSFVWLRYLEADREHNLFFYHEPYRDASVFENVSKLRDRITKEYLFDAEKPQIYIARQEREDIVGVEYDRVRFNDRYAVRGRGLWKISDNSGGGPYVGYTILDEEQQRIYYIEGYVYAPATRKKNFIRELDAILSTFATQQSPTK